MRRKLFLALGASAALWIFLVWGNTGYGWAFAAALIAFALILRAGKPGSGE